MPRHKGIRGEAWSHCDLCGFEWPINQLTRQFGALICPRHVDDLSPYRRPKLIADVLRTPEDEPELGRVMTQQTEEIFFLVPLLFLLYPVLEAVCSLRSFLT
jgi:hypothetical protein